MKLQTPVCFAIQRWRLTSLIGALFVCTYSLQASKDIFKGLVHSTFEQNCVKCHGAKEKIKGDVDLTKLSSSSDLINHPELLQDMIDVLDFEEMPPEEEEPLEDATRTELLSYLNSLLETAIAVNKEFPATPIRRMNRFQYSNAVQDLFDLKVEVFALPERMMREHENYFQPASGAMPQELKAGSRPLGKSQLIGKRLAGVTPFPQDLRAEHGFDNRADHLSLSPLLLESFLQLSRSIVESHDFNETTCGVWDELFAEPNSEASIEVVVKQRLKTFLSRAFRQPVSTTLLDRYSNYANEQIASGASFTDSMKEVASAVLASPRFLYLYDRASSENSSERISDYELASRLSFFLWGSIPDEELLDLAAMGHLSEPKILAQQVDRMLIDKKVKRFCDSFPSQWLQLERIISSVPDREKFPDFYFAKFRVSIHMMLEPLLLFETILVENRSILELIDSDFSYRSNILDAWYLGEPLPNRKSPTAVPFTRVPLLDRREGGIITNAAVMTMTSNPTRTQPITRGAWLASVIFNDPPEPPPADVPPLKEVEEAPEVADLTLRERFAAHRERVECAGCHKRIDALGFALENYGPTGKWRDLYDNAREVDSTGVLFNKHPFDDIVEFKDAILAEKDRFARAFATHLLSFSLGRETGVADTASINQMVEAINNDDYRMKALIKQVVLSESFQHKSTHPEGTAAN
ncbi:MAG: DUF1592 domain-containing protein [Opitutales bacterium]|nr:DUF1592 domain-containing protein [Opitutales bacterium]